MAREHITLGPTPCNEECQQIGPSFDPIKAREEMYRYRELLQKRFPDHVKHGCKFVIKSFPHDFGSYSEVCITYDPDNRDSVEFAFHVEGNLPSNW